MGPYRLSAPARLDCDVLVVGAGAGGACVADVLTRAGVDVVMLDEGPHVPAADAPTSLTASFKTMWRGQGLLAALGPTPVAYAEGRCVGGGTEINSAIFQRVPEELFDEWARRYEIEGFSASDFAGLYDRAAAIVGASKPPAAPGRPTEILAAGARALGWQVTALERGVRRCVATNHCSVGCPTGAKQSMSATLVPEALSRGLRLVAQCRADRLLARGGRVEGVVATATASDGRRHKVRVRARHVFVCAGAVQSAALLRRSGITHRVGNTLRLHPTVKATALFDEDVNAHDAQLPLCAVTEFMPARRYGGSVMSPALLAMSLAEDWAARKWLLPHWRRCGQYYAMVRASGTGTVRPLPFASEPLVRYNLADEDWRQLGLGLSDLAQLMFAAGARHVYPSIAGHPGWSDASEAREFDAAELPRDRVSLMTIHLFSSLPPGEARERTATDSYGNVHQVANLTVADGSQIPEAPGVNPQATIMAIALRAAEAYLSARQSNYDGVVPERKQAA